MLAWSTDSVASYVLHRHDGQNPFFFKKMTDDVLEYALTHEKKFQVYSVRTDGGVDDVTEAWVRVFEKHRTTRGAIDQLLARWSQELPGDIATMELKVDGVTLGYFPKPTIEMLRRVRDSSRMNLLVIRTNGVVEDMTAEWRHYFTEYSALRFKDMSV